MVACSSDDETEVQSFTFSFDVAVGNESMVFDSKKYQTPGNQIMTFERLKVYISNIQLRDFETGELYSENDSYHLISFDADQQTASFTLAEVPASFQVSEIIFSIGVDPDANTSIDQMGDLDPTNGMAWDWNTGYKFLLLEGRYFSENEGIGEEIKMHIGTDKNYFTMSWLLSEPLSMATAQQQSFTLDAMAPIGQVDFSEGTVFMNDERGDEIALNYKESLFYVFQKRSPQ